MWSLVFNLLLSVTGSWIAFTIVQSALVPASAGAAEDAPSGIMSVDAVLKQVRGSIRNLKSVTSASQAGRSPSSEDTNQIPHTTGLPLVTYRWT
ncbi:hypothetical protein [Pontibacter rugosus]